MTSENHSKFELTAFSKESNMCKVRIVAVSWSNVPKKVGGDIFLLWAEQTTGDGRIMGHVIDNKDGTYTGKIKCFWPGITTIKVKLGSTLENFCRRKRAMTRYGNSAFAMKKPLGIEGTFQNGGTQETTRCGLHEGIKGYSRKCNLTKLNDGSPWFCGKPSSENLKCSDIYEYNIKEFRRSEILPHQDSSEIISRKGHGELNHTVVFNFNSITTEKPAEAEKNVICGNQSQLNSWFTSGGNYLNGFWNGQDRSTARSSNFHQKVFDIKTYRKCLSNKTLVFLGDSTVRQYAAYFLSEVLLLPKMDLKNLKSKNGTYHPAIDFTRFDIRVIYKKHELPCHYIHVSARGITSVSGEIQGLSQSPISGKDLILLFNYNSHMQAFPPNHIRERLNRIAKSVESLLKAKPETTVLLKGPHVFFNDAKWFDLRVSLIVKDIILKEFQHLFDRISYLNVWSITVAFNNEHLHPMGTAFKSQIQQLMSYICCPLDC